MKRTLIIESEMTLNLLTKYYIHTHSYVQHDYFLVGPLKKKKENVAEVL